ncbi:MAG: acyl carrier protein [Alphaproteobacteria bacterium]|nr:acyl carrier protein [Alphaproteobacteria bacterium]
MTLNPREKIRAFVREQLASADAGADFADSDSLFVSGRLDSASAVQFVVFLETEFGVDFAEQGFDVTQIDSVDAMADLVAQCAGSDVRA